MFLTPFNRPIGKHEDGACVYKLYEESIDAMVSYMMFSVFAIHHIEDIVLLVSCMIFHGPMCLLRPLYRDCASMTSYVHNGRHPSNVHGV